MRVLVCGSRNYIGTEASFNVCSILDELRRTYDDLIIIEGGATGVDTHAFAYAHQFKIPYMHFPAQWDKYGKAAGPIRNKQMLDEGKPNMVIAFLAKDSRGTANMIKQARDAGVEVKVIDI
jgi:hypothetical protein